MMSATDCRTSDNRLSAGIPRESHRDGPLGDRIAKPIDHSHGDMLVVQIDTHAARGRRCYNCCRLQLDRKRWRTNGDLRAQSARQWIYRWQWRLEDNRHDS